jgi:inosine-uridine nucleoside N-ribohydrolase
MTIRTLLLSILLLSLPFINRAQQSSKPVPIIFDTDIGPDYDDVGAITLLHALADSGQATILATIASSKYPLVAPVLSVFNTYFGRPNIPIGVPKGEAVTDADKQHWSDTIVARYPHKIKSNAQVPDAVTLYRQVLSKQPDKSVTIVTVGFLTNLANLLDSKPDKHSKLTGKELVARKVKSLVSMAGKFPEGREFNVFKDAAASKRVFDEWPTPVLLSGFEIGEKIKTGLPLVENQQIRNSPVKDVFRISIPLDPADKDGRMSWDQTAVLVAIKGASPYYTTQRGRILTQAEGSNTWDVSGKGHSYLVEKMPVVEVTQIINNYMMHQPVKQTRTGQ